MHPESGGLPIIHADWPAPARVRALSTTRSGGVSAAPYASFNLGAHVGDDPGAVAANRARLRSALGLPGEPAWLEQVHGTEVVDAARAARPPCADASVAFAPGVACAVLTADCLPVLLCTETGDRVAAVHAGWRGLAAGILEAAVARLQAPPGAMLAWLGPAIGPAHYEVGAEVRRAFADLPGAEAAFRPGRPGHWLADLYALARLRLRRAGVAGVFGGTRCTYAEAGSFFSYRREARTGRMASLIWIEP